MNKRWFIWVPALGIAAWLASSAPTTDTEVVAATTTSGGSTTMRKPLRQDTPLPLLIDRKTLFPQRKSSQRRDLFASVSWIAPVAPVAPVDPLPPASVAPDLTFIGKQFDGEHWEVFLSRAERTFIVRVGSLIEENFRVEAIEPPALTLVDLKTLQSHSIPIGDGP